MKIEIHDEAEFKGVVMLMLCILLSFFYVVWGEEVLDTIAMSLALLTYFRFRGSP